MAELQATDQFLVNRGDQVKTVEQQALMATLEPTDLLVVNRADVTYAITGQELEDSLIDPLIISQPVLSTNSPEVGQTITASASASGGKGPYTYAYQWLKTGDIEITGANFATYTPVIADEDETLACRVTATDAQPESATGTSNYTNAVIVPASPPSIASIALTEDSPGGDRFTSKTFTTAIVMNDDGVPSSDKEVKAEVSGALSIAGATDEITNVETSVAQVLDASSARLSPMSQLLASPGTTGAIKFATNGSKCQISYIGGDANLQYTVVAAVGMSTLIDNIFTQDATVEQLNSVFTSPNWSSTGSTSAATEAKLYFGYKDVDSYILLEYANPANANWNVYTTSTSGSGAPNTITAGGETTLTLASDANLANGVFVSGNLVKQNNSPIVPVTSEITNVAPVASPYPLTYRYLSNGAAANNSYNDAGNEEVDNGGGPTEASSFTSMFIAASSASLVFEFGMGVEYPDIGITVFGTNDPDSKTWAVAAYAGAQSSGGSAVGRVVLSGYLYYQAVRSDNILHPIAATTTPTSTLLGAGGWSAGVATGTTLTLQNASGLSAFEVGDVVSNQTVGPWLGCVKEVSANDSSYDSGSDYVNLRDGLTYAVTPNNMLIIDMEALGPASLTFTKVPNSGTFGFMNYNLNTPTQTGQGTVIYYPDGAGGTTRFVDTFTIPQEGITYGPYLRVYGEGGGVFSYTVSGTAAGEPAISVSAIDENTPSITTDGGTWSVGEVVTGPEKNITGTFVSADPSVPSMTLSDATGPWSANTGNFAQNTVVNPITIKPETSAITDVASVTNNYTGNLSANKPWAAASPETNAFDGDPMTLAALDSGAADATITWDASSYNLSTDNGNVVVRSASTTVNWEVTGSLGTSTVSAVSDPAGGALPSVGMLQTLKVVGPAASLMFVQAGGVILTDGTSITTLTLQDATDLNQFVAGDEVYANTSYTPTTSAITNVIELDGTWTVSPASVNSWRSVTYGETSTASADIAAGIGLFVAVAFDGTNQVMYSTDAISWTAPPSGTNVSEWQSVTYGNGMFVAVATGGTGDRVMYSTDGISWEGASAPGNVQWMLVTYGNGKFVAVGRDVINSVMYSTNGIDWTAADATEANYWRSVVYGGAPGDEKFVAVSLNGDNRVMYSTDAKSWTEASAAEASPWASVTYGNGKFVAVAYGGAGDRVMYSTDGISWTAAAAPEANAWNSVTYGDGKFVAVAYSGTTNRAMYSTDGISWTSVATAASGWYSVTYADGKFVSVSSSGTDQVMWSYTGTGSPQTELTLTDDTDLENFRVGDVVQGSGDAGSWVIGSAVSSGYSLDASSGELTAITGTGSYGFVAVSDASVPAGSFKKFLVTVKSPAAASSLFNFSVNSTAADATDRPGYAVSSSNGYCVNLQSDKIRFVNNGTEVSSFPVTPLPGGNVINKDGQVNISLNRTTNTLTIETDFYGSMVTFSSVMPAQSGNLYFGFASNNHANVVINRVTTSATQTKVTAIDEAAPSITTDGGSWSGTDGTGDPAGDTFVTGPTFTGTGTVASTDPTGPTMTLSASTKWATSTKVTMDEKPAVSSTAYLKFDSNGNVTGYQSVDPGYVNMGLGSSKTLTFPPTFNSGGTPDVELPAGTSIRTRIKATNPSGSSESSWSDRVTPGTTTLNLAMGETVYLLDRFNATTNTMATYGVRETENECLVAQAAYDADAAALAARLAEIQATYGS